MNPTTRVLVAAVIAGSLAAQTEAVPSRNHKRVAAADVVEAHLLRWGAGGMPDLPRKVGVENLRLAFTGDGLHIALQLGNAWHCIEVATGKRSSLAAGLPPLWGSGPGARVLASRHGGLAWVTLPSGELENVVEENRPPPPRRGVAILGEASMRVWLVAPDGSRAVCSHPPQIVELTSMAATPLPGSGTPSFAAWTADGQRVAVSRLDGQKSALEVFDRAGTSLVAFAGDRAWFSEFDLSGRFVWWTGPSLQRGEVATGSIRVLKGPDQFWFWQVDPVLGIGLDGTEFCLWNLIDLQSVRRIPIGDHRPADADEVDPRTFGKLRWFQGCVLGPTAVASPLRDRIALATLAGLRIYRVKN